MEETGMVRGGMNGISSSSACSSTDEGERSRRRVFGGFGRPAALAAAVATAVVASLGSGVASASADQMAYVANFGSGSVTPVDVTTGTPGTAIPTGGRPDGIAISPDGSLAYTGNNLDGTITPIDLASQTPGRNIPVGLGLGPVVFSPDGSTAFALDFGNGGQLDAIDVASGAVEGTVTIGSGMKSLAMTPDGTEMLVVRAISKNSGSVIPVSISNPQAMVAGTPITAGNQSNQGIAISPDGSTAYMTDGASVWQINLATSAVSVPFNGSVPTLGTIVVSPDGKFAIAADSNARTVSRLNLTNDTVTATITAAPTGYSTSGVAISPDGKTALVTDLGVFDGATPNFATPVDLTSNTAGAPITVGNYPETDAFAPAPVAQPAPVCSVSAIRRAGTGGFSGSFDQEDVTVSAAAGLSDIFGESITNGTIEIPSFAPGTTGPVTVTATKAVQGTPTFWSFNATDNANNATHCG